ncbi:hypothetical protein PMAYCL1PPCAC_22281, partial [Pristionchus mayeri]
IFLQKSKFHTDTDSTGAKQLICHYDSGYICDEGEQSADIPGKCVATAHEKTNVADAEQYCKSLGMEIPSVNNGLENKMIRG